VQHLPRFREPGRSRNFDIIGAPALLPAFDSRGPVPKASAGLLLFRFVNGTPEVLLVHPGGPFWARKDSGAWMIPKGEIAAGEEPLDAAQREFTEETGATASGEFIALHPRRQAGGKLVHAWAVFGEFDPARLTSTTFNMEWPPRSGQQKAFPEVDRAVWLTFNDARKKILDSQRGFLDELEDILKQRAV
jgi:predicted NUDIX family NTP pyrophosphohydrolase